MAPSSKLRADGFAEDPEIVLGVLHAIDSDRNLTQRSVARELDIALGLANAYLKHCVRKGLVKVQQAPARRYAYYLTPKGFAEKSRLTASFLSSHFSFFRKARSQCAEAFALANTQGWTRIALVGPGDLAEIAGLCARDHRVEIVGVLDPRAAMAAWAGPAFDAVLVTDMESPQATYERLAKVLGEARVLRPAILKIRRRTTPKPQDRIRG